MKISRREVNPVMKVWNIGLVGCGTISRAYVKGLAAYDHVRIAAVADIDSAATAKLAQEIDCPALAVRDLLARDDIDIVLNLTIPRAHAEVDLLAIAAGKHVYSEKPLALDRAQGMAVMEAARRQGVRVGCAPDTFLGGGGQTSRKLIDEGLIGTPVAASAFMMSRGHETWHPSPTFYYQKGGGPMLDMGPYYVTALVNLLGPISRVSGMTRTSFPERIITSEPLAGTVIHPEVPTHYAGMVQFALGAIGTIVQTFDVCGANLPRIEIYGEEGTLSVPDPNTFRGPVLHLARGSRTWNEIPLTHSDTVLRGVGLAEMADAIATGRDHRASGQLAYHVLEVMDLFAVSHDQAQHLDTVSHCTRPALLPIDGTF